MKLSRVFTWNSRDEKSKKHEKKIFTIPLEVQSQNEDLQTNKRNVRKEKDYHAFSRTRPIY